VCTPARTAAPCTGSRPHACTKHRNRVRGGGYHCELSEGRLRCDSWWYPNRSTQLGELARLLTPKRLYHHREVDREHWVSDGAYQSMEAPLGYDRSSMG
jgi:hypothetical protein